MTQITYCKGNRHSSVTRVVFLAVSLSPKYSSIWINLVPRALLPGFIWGGAGKGPCISRSHDHQTPRICGCTKHPHLHTSTPTPPPKPGKSGPNLVRKRYLCYAYNFKSASFRASKCRLYRAQLLRIASLVIRVLMLARLTENPPFWILFTQISLRQKVRHSNTPPWQGG